MLKELPPIPPMSFFSLEYSIKKKRHYSRITTALFEQSFVDCKVRFDDEGLQFVFTFDVPFQEAHFPNVAQGDGLELFIDTRNMKSAKSTTRFCHHFVFLPVAVDGVQAVEVTRFRGEERHELADPKALLCSASMASKKYCLEITLPKEVLHGYSPSDNPRIGCAFIAHRKGGKPAHFGPTSEWFALETAPFLWPTLHLKE